MYEYELKWGAFCVVGVIFGFALIAWSASPYKVEAEKTRQLELQLEIVKAGGNVK